MPAASGPPDAALVQEARTLRSECLDDMILLSTATRWVGYIQAGRLWLSNHDTERCIALWQQALLLWDAAYHPRAPTAFPSEDTLVTQVVRHLRHQGWDCTREVRTPYGRIDILATQQEAVWVIEAKLSTDGRPLTYALGQLLGSQASYPQARLGIATPTALPAHFLTLFRRYHIHPVEGPWTTPTDQR